MKKYSLKKNNWTMKVLPVLCILFASLIILGIVTQNPDPYDCETLGKIFESDFEGDLASDPLLKQAWFDCLTTR